MKCPSDPEKILSRTWSLWWKLSAAEWRNEILKLISCSNRGKFPTRKILIPGENTFVLFLVCNTIKPNHSCAQPGTLWISLLQPRLRRVSVLTGALVDPRPASVHQIPASHSATKIERVQSNHHQRHVGCHVENDVMVQLPFVYVERTCRQKNVPHPGRSVIFAVMTTWNKHAAREDSADDQVKIWTRIFCTCRGRFKTRAEVNTDRTNFTKWFWHQLLPMAFQMFGTCWYSQLSLDRPENLGL